jgi:hypothetical protein
MAAKVMVLLPFALNIAFMEQLTVMRTGQNFRSGDI